MGLTGTTVPELPPGNPSNTMYLAWAGGYGCHFLPDSVHILVVLGERLAYPAELVGSCRHILDAALPAGRQDAHVRISARHKAYML